MYYNIKKHKDFFYLNLFVYLIPFTIILGNLAINILSTICVILFIVNILNKNYFFKYKNFIYIFFLFSILYLINIFYSSNHSLSSVSYIGFFRYYFLFLCILFCLNEIENFKNVFLNIIFYLLLFVILDVFIQHLFHVDILGNKIDSSHGRRLSGPFGDEKVAGTFITKLFFVSLILFYKKNYFKKIIFPLIFLTFTAVILTNERSATIMFMSSVIIFITFYKFKLVHKMLFFLSLIFLIFTVLYTNDNLKKHFIEIPLKAFGDNHHKAHFLTAYEIYKDNKIIGSGVKTYREVCSNDDYNSIDTKFSKYRCSTHPHNIYLEILSEAGIIGLGIFFLINSYFLYFFVNNYLKKSKEIEVLVLLFCFFFVLFWPLQTTGAFFSTWNGIFFWFFYAFFFNYKKN
tara:strand:+ start:4222 stop:5427 length:1206 start_codon:yes stop_codon:yes gene_type:complete